MTEKKQTAISAVESKKDLIEKTADQIWDYAGALSARRKISSILLPGSRGRRNFRWNAGICGIQTAFSASFGNGSPRIGILAEYDALSGLSQTAGSLELQERVPGGCGHGCGHNLLGAGSFGAALGVKAYLEKTGSLRNCYSVWLSR